MSKARKILNLTTGEEYPSITNAVEVCGLSRSGIARAIANGTIYHGSKWAYGSPHVNAIPLRCVNTGEIFPSSRAAATKTGCHHQSILRCANGTQKSAKSKDDGKCYKWEYQQ